MAREFVEEFGLSAGGAQRSASRSMKKIPYTLRIILFLSLLIKPVVHLAQTFSEQETPVEITVPMMPIPTPAGGKIVLAYELHITNFDVRELSLTRLEIRNGEATERPLVVYEGDALAALMQPLALYGKPADKRRIGAGVRTIVYIWLALDSGQPLPLVLKNRLIFAPKPSSENKPTSEMISEVSVAVSKDKPVVISPPLRGAIWLAGNGPGNTYENHRRGIAIVDGKAYLASGFAIDWVQYGNNDKNFKNDQFKNADYYAYGAEVLAVADGVISAIKDGIPENVPGPTSRAVPITLETVAGNYVMLNLGDAGYALYAHLQPNSLRVRVGQKIRQGQVLALVGNSGNSDAPHLHFHICKANSPLGSEGLPFVFRSFELIGRDGRALPNGNTEEHRNEMPLMNDVFTFRVAER